jgi:hypothetical protein
VLGSHENLGAATKKGYEERSNQKTKTARLFRLAVVIAGALA